MKFADTPPVYTLRDVGVIGLYSHDIFAWDHKKEINTENGRLDLSMIFDYNGGSRWALGGNPKNSENAPVYPVASSFKQADMLRKLAEVGAGQMSIDHGPMLDMWMSFSQKPFAQKAIAGCQQFPANRQET